MASGSAFEPARTAFVADSRSRRETMAEGVSGEERKRGRDVLLREGRIFRSLVGGRI